MLKEMGIQASLIFISCSRKMVPTIVMILLARVPSLARKRPHIGLELVHRFDKIVRAQNLFFVLGWLVHSKKCGFEIFLLSPLENNFFVQKWQKFGQKWLHFFLLHFFLRSLLMGLALDCVGSNFAQQINSPADPIEKFQNHTFWNALTNQQQFCQTLRTNVATHAAPQSL